MNERQVVISGVRAVTPYGLGAINFWENIIKGRSAATPIDTFDVSSLPTRFAAQVPLSDSQLDSHIENKKSLKTMSRSAKYAVIAADEAVKDSKIDSSRLNPYRFGTSLGASGVGLWDLEYANQNLDVFLRSVDNSDGLQLDSSKVWKNTLDYIHPLTPLKALSNIATAHIAINHNARGNCQTITTACTSSAQAVGEAYRQIKSGIADVIIAGGRDSMINPNGLVAFSMLGVLSKNNQEYQTAARPFDKRRDGFMLGDGAAIFVLEELQHCKDRAAQPYAEIIGYSSVCDAFRLTDEPPDAWGSVEAMRIALQDAAIKPGDVDYINAHGTGTVMNDKTETLAIKKVFKENAYSIPVSSTKSMIGHLVAAAGAVELTACVMSMKNQQIPPTINYEKTDPDCDLDYVPNRSRKAQLDIILSNSFGFGGQNACLLIKKVS